MVNEEQVREALIKKTRRDLLTTLKMVYPASFSFYDLRLTLPDVEIRYLQIDISYLVDKGYVRWVNRSANTGWDQRDYRLTADGVETADRINKDPAIYQS